MQQPQWDQWDEYLKLLPWDMKQRCKWTKQKPEIHSSYTYYGPHFSDMRHGVYGISISLTASNTLLVYQGGWSTNQRHGPGSEYVIDKSPVPYIKWTEGIWQSNCLNGSSTIKMYEEGKWKTVFKGQFVNNYKEGLGYECCQGITYVGQFHEGNRHGKGRLSDGNGIYYDGLFQNGIISGKGLEKNNNIYTLIDQYGDARSFKISPKIIDFLMETI